MCLKPWASLMCLAPPALLVASAWPGMTLPGLFDGLDRQGSVSGAQRCWCLHPAAASFPCMLGGLLSPVSPSPGSAVGRLAWSPGSLIPWEHKDWHVP